MMGTVAATSNIVATQSIVNSTVKKQNKVCKEGWLYQRIVQPSSFFASLFKSNSGSSINIVPRYVVLWTVDEDSLPQLALFEQRSDARPPYGRPSDSINLDKEIKIELKGGTNSSISMTRAPSEKSITGSMARMPLNSRRSSIVSYTDSIEAPPVKGTNSSKFLLIIRSTRESSKSKRIILEFPNEWERADWIRIINEMQLEREERIRGAFQVPAIALPIQEIHQKEPPSLAGLSAFGVEIASHELLNSLADNNAAGLLCFDVPTQPIILSQAKGTDSSTTFGVMPKTARMLTVTCPSAMDYFWTISERRRCSIKGGHQREEWECRRLVLLQKFRTAATRAVRRLVDDSLKDTLICDPRREYLDGSLRLRFVYDYQADDATEEDIEVVHRETRRELLAAAWVAEQDSLPLHTTLMTVVEYRAMWIMAYLETPLQPGSSITTTEGEGSNQIWTQVNVALGGALGDLDCDAHQLYVYQESGQKDREELFLTRVGQLLPLLEGQWVARPELMLTHPGQSTSLSASLQTALHRLLQDLESCDVLPLDSGEWSRELHSRGINIHCLGWLARSTQLPHVRDALVTEMVARCVKHVLRPAIRSMLLQYRVYQVAMLEDELRNLAVTAINALMGHAANSTGITSLSLPEPIKVLLLSKFGWNCTGIKTGDQITLTPSSTPHLNPAPLFDALIYQCSIDCCPGNPGTTTGICNTDIVGFKTKVITPLLVCHQFLSTWTCIMQQEPLQTSDEKSLVMARCMAAGIPVYDKLYAGIILSQLPGCEQFSRILIPLNHPSATLVNGGDLDLVLAYFGSSNERTSAGVSPTHVFDHPLTILLASKQADTLDTLNVHGPGPHSNHHTLANGLRQQALSGSLKGLGRTHHWTRRLIIQIGYHHMTKGAWDDALAFLLDAVKSIEQEETLGPTPEKQQTPQNDLGLLIETISFSNAAPLHFAIARCHEHKEDFEQGYKACTVALKSLNHGNPGQSVIYQDILILSISLSLVIYSMHCTDILITRPLSEIGKYGHNCGFSLHPCTIACLGPLPHPMPLITEEAQSRLLQAFDHIEALLIFSSNHSTPAIKSIQPLLVRQAAAIAVRLAPASRRIIIDSLAVPEFSLFTPTADPHQSPSNSSNITRIKNIVDQGSLEQLADLIAFANGK